MIEDLRTHLVNVVGKASQDAMSLSLEPSGMNLNHVFSSEKEPMAAMNGNYGSHIVVNHEGIPFRDDGLMVSTELTRRSMIELLRMDDEGPMPRINVYGTVESVQHELENGAHNAGHFNGYLDALTNPMVPAENECFINNPSEYSERVGSVLGSDLSNMGMIGTPESQRLSQVNQALEVEDENLPACPQPRQRSRGCPELPLQLILSNPQCPASESSAWCAHCASDHPTPTCPTLGPARFIEDNPMPSMAFITCPPCLRIGVVPSGEPVRGIFVKKQLPARTWFGPFRADTAEKETEAAMYPSDPGPGSRRFLLPVAVTQDDGTSIVRHLVRTNEFCCTWMMFVRPADCVQHQNCVALQFQGAIYFYTVVGLIRGDELRVWYAPSYAQVWGFPLLSPPNIPIPVVHEPASDKSNFNIVAANSPASVHPPATPHPGSELREGSHRPGKQSSDVTGTPRRSKRRRVSTYKGRERKRMMQSTMSAARRKLRSAMKKARQKSVTDEMHCFDCGLTFNHDDIFQVHKMLHRGFPTDRDNCAGCKCAVCQLRLPDATTYAQHAVVHRIAPVVFCDTETPLRREDGEYACGRCHRRTTSLRTLTQHKLQHLQPPRNPKEEFVCQICKEVFRSHGALSTHIKKHAGSYYFACIVCREEFYTRADYIEHGHEHRRGDEYPCPFCVGDASRSASNRLGLYRSFTQLCNHVRQVHAARTHVCPQCDRAFPRRSKLVQHMASHSQPGFECEVCGQRFKRKDKCVRHMRRRHGRPEEKKRAKRPRVSCPHCSKTLSSGSYLRRHISQKHMAFMGTPSPSSKHRVGEVPMAIKDNKKFQCLFCPKAYVKEATLTRHVKKHHPSPVGEPTNGNCVVYDVGASSLTDLLMAPSHTFLQTGPELPMAQHYLMMLPERPHNEVPAIDGEATAYESFIVNVGEHPGSPNLLEEFQLQVQPQTSHQPQLLPEMLQGFSHDLLSPEHDPHLMADHPPGSWML